MPQLTLDGLIASHFTLEAGTSKGGNVGFTLLQELHRITD